MAALVFKLCMQIDVCSLLCHRFLLGQFCTLCKHFNLSFKLTDDSFSNYLPCIQAQMEESVETGTLDAKVRKDHLAEQDHVEQRAK